MRRFLTLPDPKDIPVSDLLHKMLEALVDRPEFVTIQTRQDFDFLPFCVQVHPDDTGKVIGKQGRNATSLRIVLSAIGRKHHQRSAIEVIET